MACEDKFNTKCPGTAANKTCSPFQLTKNEKDLCVIDNFTNEALNIGGADVHVFKLLGIHEQGLLVDLTGNGSPLSSGDQSIFPASNAFDTSSSEWRSLQVGTGVVQTSYLGYDFGTIKIDNGRERYGVDTSIKQHITTITIKQGPVATNRITRARVERSSDGQTWYGSAVIDLPNDGDEHTISFRESAPSRYWRLRPLLFNGSTTDFWSVVKLQLVDYKETALENLQDDLGFLESRNRDYASQSVTVKAFYDLIDTQSELTKFGIDLPGQMFYFHVNFNACVAILGRPIVVGDIFELPSETQYTPTMVPVKKYVEVTDVAWATDGYTPGWQPTLQRIIAQPALATEETQDVFGDLVPSVDSSGLLTVDTTKYTDLTDINAKVQAAGTTQVPERGEDTTNVAEIPTEQIEAAAAQGYDIAKLSLNSKALYIEDGLPPNGASYTEGDTLPTIPGPADGAYHRLTYSGLADNIPPRLYRYSLTKNRWIYLETDRRQEFNKPKPRLQYFLSSTTKVDPNKIGE